MRRRALLALAAPLVGGCLSAGRIGSPADGGNAALPPTGDGAPMQFDADDHFERWTVGGPDAGTGHRIVVWNDDADRRPIRVRLRAVGGEPDEPALSAAPTFPPYGSLRVTVFQPADYVCAVAAPEGDGRELGVRREFVGCDDSATHVAVRPDGSVRARVVSTALGCPGGTAKPDSAPE